MRHSAKTHSHTHTPTTALSFLPASEDFTDLNLVLSRVDLSTHHLVAHVRISVPLCAFKCMKTLRQDIRQTHECISQKASQHDPTVTFSFKRCC